MNLKIVDRAAPGIFSGLTELAGNMVLGVTLTVAHILAQPWMA